MGKSNVKYLLLIVLTFPLTLAAQNATPKNAVEAFYRFDMNHDQAFERRNILARKRWLSADLYSLLLNELRRQAEFVRRNPDEKPYFGDGLPFQPPQEPCDGPNPRGRQIAVKQEFRRGNRAAATTTFSYPRPCPSPDPIVYTIGLIKTRSGWLIDDINYGEDTTLKQRLRRKEY